MELSGVAPVVLGFLSFGPRSGYEIKAAVDRSTRFFWAASYGQIYPELRRLEEEGLVRGKSSPTGGRRRTFYEITDAGAAALRAWLREPGAGYELRDRGLLKLFFADNLAHDETLELIRSMRREREEILARLREVDAAHPPPRKDMRGVVLDYGLEFHEWVIDWCNRTEKRLAAEPPARKTRRKAA